MDTAQVVHEAEKVAEPEALRLAPLLPGPFPVTVADAYAAVKAKLQTGVRYDITFLSDDGAILRRFSRKTPREAWLIATPINDEGRPLPMEHRVVFPIAFDGTPDQFGPTFEQALIAELDALKAADRDA